MGLLDTFVYEYYTKLRPGGTLIIWFDLWKITELTRIMEKYHFKQIRMIEWIKNNPQPINSTKKKNPNCRDIALVGVKRSNPTFNSKYDNGIYEYPVQGGIYKCHPTQTNISLFEDLIRKHSDENDVVLDTFFWGWNDVICL
jgi:site-specific DNA-methyltransferase (adenine-specific)